MTTTTVAPSTIDDAHAAKNGELHRRYLRAMIDDPDGSYDVPNGALLVLLPDDGDEAFAASEVEIGLLHLRRGRNVYFRHVSLADLPEVPSVDPPRFVRRTRYNPDGSVAAEETAGPDGTWVPAERSEEEGR